MVNYAGEGAYDEGTRTFRLPGSNWPTTALRCAARGHWTTRAPPQPNDDNAITLNYHARNVYLVVGGSGTVTVTRDGAKTTIPVSGPPNMRQIVADDEDGAGSLEVSLSKGLQAFSFTYG